MHQFVFDYYLLFYPALVTLPFFLPNEKWLLFFAALGLAATLLAKLPFRPDAGNGLEATLSVGAMALLSAGLLSALATRAIVLRFWQASPTFEKVIYGAGALLVLQVLFLIPFFLLWLFKKPA